MQNELRQMPYKLELIEKNNEKSKEEKYQQ